MVFEVGKVGVAPIKEVTWLEFIFLKFWDSYFELVGFDWQAGIESFLFGVKALVPLSQKEVR
ncbi:MAG: hypothetical protein QXR19_02550 [Candidatus Jordarchaeaceae archaeon]